MSVSQGVLLGVDVGTTNVKAVAFAPSGEQVAAHALRLPVLKPKAGWAEYDPAVVLDTSIEVIRTVADTVRSSGAGPILAVATSSMAETAVPLDRNGAPVHNAIAWYDERTDDQARWWRTHVGQDRIGSITGLPILPIFGINKILWLRENAPDAFARTVDWANMADFVAYRLSGVLATDFSLASRSMVLDIGRREWSDELLGACGIDRGLFAELVPSGTDLGPVTRDAASATGLAPTTRVVAGGHDHPCGAFALGLVDEGDVLDSIGTSESILTTMREAATDPRVAAAGYQQGVHVVPDRTYCNGGLWTCGAVVEWARSALMDDDRHDAEAFVRLARNGADAGLLFLPHLRMANPPHADNASRGAFLGLSLATTKADMARAVVRGLAYEAHQSLEGMERLLSFEAYRLRITGGGSRNALLMEDKATLFRGSTEIAHVDEASALGAAMLAGIGAGVFASAREAVDAMSPAGTVVKPSVDPAARQQMRRGFELYRSLYETTASLHHELVERGESSASS